MAERQSKGHGGDATTLIHDRLTLTADEKLMKLRSTPVRPAEVAVNELSLPWNEERTVAAALLAPGWPAG